MTPPAQIPQELDQSLPIGAQLYAVLRARIVQVELVPGVRLSESGVAGEFQVSRQPVREVFIKLAEEGLLEIRPQRGSVIPKISQTKVEDARFVREAIEADVVRQAAAQFTRSQTAELDQILVAQKRSGDVHDFITLDDHFHRALAQGAGHAHAWNVIEVQKVHLDRVRYLSLKQFPKAALIEQHAQVIEAIRQGDPDQAEQAMRTHLRMISSDLPEIAREHSDYFKPAPLGAS